MGAVWMRVRAELRARWRATIGLALLIAIGGGAVIALAQAARRTDSAYPRFLREYNAADVVVFNHAFDAQPVTRADLEAIPEVAEIEGIKFAPVGTREFVPGYSRESDPFAPGALDGAKVIEGRAADPTAVDEVVVTLLGREQAGEGEYEDLSLDVGDPIQLRFFDPAPEEFAEYGAALNADPVDARIVGVVAIPGGFPPQVTEIGSFIQMTPAFYERYPHAFAGAIESSFLVRLERGARDMPAFTTAIVDATGGRPPFVVGRDKQDANVQSGIHLQSLAIWLLAAITGLTVALIVVQALTRQVFLDAGDHPALRALGMSRGQLVSAAVLRVLVTLALASVFALAGAAAVSSFAPVGVARIAEPSPGPAIDVPAYAAGVACIILVGALSAAAASWSLARARDRESRQRPSMVVGAVARAFGGALVPAGVRLALEPGRGRRAVPVRATIAGIAVALGALVASLTFDASLRTLIDEPRQHGIGWDAAIAGDQRTDFPEDGRRLLDLPEVRGVAIGSLGAPLTFDGVPAETMAFDHVGGDVGLAVIEGRAPRDVGSDDPIEILLGTRTLRSIGASVGDQVVVGLDEQSGGAGPEVPGVVVGRGIPVSNSELTRLGEGAVVVTSGIARIAGDRFASEVRPDTAFFVLEPGTDVDAFEETIAELYTPGRRFGEVLFKPPLAKPNDLVSFASVSQLPLVLIGVIGLLCVAILIHTLVSFIRRRRGDLAVLKTLGFGRAQVFGAVAIQSTVLAVVSVVVGLPLGAIVGRLSWSAFAGALGVSPDPTTPAGPVWLIVPSALVLANVIAALPARAAARTSPALVLREE